jgi:hypothetical protein
MSAYNGSFPVTFVSLGKVDELFEKDIMKALEEITRLISKDLKGFSVPEVKITAKKQLTSDAINAAYRVGANQLLSLTKNILVQRMRHRLSEESKIEVFVEMLDTEVGKALMGMFVGTAISQLPQVKNHPRTERLLKELRVSGMATLGNSAIESLFSAALPALTEVLVNADKENKKADDTSSAEDLNELLADAELTKELLLSC